MKMKNLIFLAVLDFATSLPTLAADGELTGDTALSCQAILCLSSPTNPSECEPSLMRYFGIWNWNWPQTIQDRLKFLNICPTSNSSTDMSSSVNNLAQTTGFYWNDRMFTGITPADLLLNH